MMKYGKILAIMAVLLIVLSGFSFADEMEIEGFKPPVCPPDGECKDTAKHEVCVVVKQVCELILGPGVTLELNGSTKGAVSKIEKTNIEWKYSGPPSAKAKITAKLQGTFPNVDLYAQIGTAGFKKVDVGQATTLLSGITKDGKANLYYQAKATGNVPEPKMCREVVYTLTDK
jgi:hypothetical protein